MVTNGIMAFFRAWTAMTTAGLRPFAWAVRM